MIIWELGWVRFFFYPNFFQDFDAHWLLLKAITVTGALFIGGINFGEISLKSGH